MELTGGIITKMNQKADPSTDNSYDTTDLQKLADELARDAEAQLSKEQNRARTDDVNDNGEVNETDTNDDSNIDDMVTGDSDKIGRAHV